MASDVGDLQNQIVRRLELDSKVPLLVARVFEVLRHWVKISEVGHGRRKRAQAGQGRRLRRRRARKQIRHRIAAGESGCAEKGNRAREWRCESQIGNRILIDEIVGDSIATAENELTAARVPGKAQTGRRIVVAVERRASQVDSAKRANSQSANGRVIVRIKVGDQITAFRYAARTLPTESEIECERLGHAEVILDESESIEGEVMPVGGAQYLLPLRGCSSLESRDVGIDKDSQSLRRKGAGCLVAINISTKLNCVSPSRPGDGVRVLKSILRSSLRNNVGLSKGRGSIAEEKLRAGRERRIHRELWIGSSKAKMKGVDEVSGQHRRITDGDVARFGCVRRAKAGKICAYESETGTDDHRRALAILNEKSVFPAAQNLIDAQRPGVSMQGIGRCLGQTSRRGSESAIGVKYRQGSRTGDAGSLRRRQNVGDHGLPCTGRSIDLPGTVKECVVLDDRCSESHSTLVLHDLRDWPASGREVTTSVSQTTILEVVIR